MLHTKAVNLTLFIPLLMLAGPAPEPGLSGVLSGYHDRVSHWVEYERGLKSPPTSRFRWPHARGWMPQVSVNTAKNQLLVTMSPPGARDGKQAQLWQYQLENGEKKFWAQDVEPRQAALPTPWGPLYVVRDLDFKHVFLGAQSLVREKAQLWWPLEFQKDRAFVLVLQNARLQLKQINLPSGELSVLKDWGSDPVRDFSFIGSTVTYQRQLTAKKFAVERFDLSLKKTTQLAVFTEAWLAPLVVDQKVLISRSRNATQGRLVTWSKNGIQDGPNLGKGAPIPVKSSGTNALIRLQSKNAQTYYVWSSGRDQVIKVNTQGKLLESVHISEGRQR